MRLWQNLNLSVDKHCLTHRPTQRPRPEHVKLHGVTQVPTLVLTLHVVDGSTLLVNRRNDIICSDDVRKEGIDLMPRDAKLFATEHNAGRGKRNAGDLHVRRHDAGNGTTETMPCDCQKVRAGCDAPGVRVDRLPVVPTLRFRRAPHLLCKGFDARGQIDKVHNNSFREHGGPREDHRHELEQERLEVHAHVLQKIRHGRGVCAADRNDRRVQRFTVELVKDEACSGADVRVMEMCNLPVDVLALTVSAVELQKHIEVVVVLKIGQEVEVGQVTDVHVLVGAEASRTHTIICTRTCRSISDFLFIDHRRRPLHEGMERRGMHGDG
eukprot:PhM_4_TR8458/c0_g1_i1/m.1203